MGTRQKPCSSTRYIHKKFAQTGAVLQLKQSFLKALPAYQARPIVTVWERVAGLILRGKFRKPKCRHTRIGGTLSQIEAAYVTLPSRDGACR